MNPQALLKSTSGSTKAYAVLSGRCFGRTHLANIYGADVVRLLAEATMSDETFRCLGCGFKVDPRTAVFTEGFHLGCSTERKKRIAQRQIPDGQTQLGELLELHDVPVEKP